jgi:hypothetical protein
MGRLLKRFELFVSLKTRKDFKLVFEELNVDTIRELDYYIRHEHLFVSDPDYQVIFEEIPEKRRPQLRGQNTIIKIMMRFRTFIMWAMKEQHLGSVTLMFCSPFWMASSNGFFDLTSVMVLFLLIHLSKTAITLKNCYIPSEK